MKIYLLLGLLGWTVALVSIILLTAVAKKPKPDGVIRINTHDPEKDVYTLELAIPFGELDLREEVIFSIEHE